MKKTINTTTENGETRIIADCKQCGEELIDCTSHRPGLCDECADTMDSIDRGEFHDPDLLARDKEERM